MKTSSLVPGIIPCIKKAVFFAKRHLDEFVCDAVNLEGIDYSLPEVQTLLDGITVGGHKISDQIITLNQAEAWRFLFESARGNTFTVSKEMACKIHRIAAKEEALTWGEFRTGSVRISGTEYTPPPFNELEKCWQDMMSQIEKISDPIESAIILFLQISRNQFFYDVNKRMGRFMMNGILLQAGYPAINLPASRKEEFNNLMLDFYDSNEVAPMTEFMKSCLDKRIIAIMSEDH